MNSDLRTYLEKYNRSPKETETETVRERGASRKVGMLSSISQYQIRWDMRDPRESYV